jgi:hypothetical protein
MCETDFVKLKKIFEYERDELFQLEKNSFVETSGTTEMSARPFLLLCVKGAEDRGEHHQAAGAGAEVLALKARYPRPYLRCTQASTAAWSESAPAVPAN